MSVSIKRRIDSRTTVEVQAESVEESVTLMTNTLNHVAESRNVLAKSFKKKIVPFATVEAETRKASTDSGASNRPPRRAGV